MKLQQMMMATPSSPRRFGADGEGFQVLDLVFFSHQSPPSHGPKIIPKGSKNSQRTSSPIRYSPQLRRVAPPGAWCLPLAFGETRGVFHDGRRENNMDFS